MDGTAHHKEKLENLIHLAEMCVDQLQQNEEHYAEVSFCKNVFLFITILFELLS